MDDETLKRHIFEYIDKLSPDETLSLKKLRETLEKQLGVNLEDKKKQIKQFVNEYAAEKDEEDELLPKKKEREEEKKEKEEKTKEKEPPKKKRKQETPPKKKQTTTEEEEKPPTNSSGIPEYISVLS